MQQHPIKTITKYQNLTSTIPKHNESDPIKSHQMMTVPSQHSRSKTNPTNKSPIATSTNTNSPQNQPHPNIRQTTIISAPTKHLQNQSHRNIRHFPVPLQLPNLQINSRITTFSTFHCYHCGKRGRNIKTNTPPKTNTIFSQTRTQTQKSRKKIDSTGYGLSDGF